MLAWMLHDRPLPTTIGVNALLLAMILVPVAMIALEPDLGTAIMISLTGLIVIFLAGLDIRYVLSAIPISPRPLSAVGNFICSPTRNSGY